MRRNTRTARPVERRLQVTTRKRQRIRTIQAGKDIRQDHTAKRRTRTGRRGRKERKRHQEQRATGRNATEGTYPETHAGHGAPQGFPVPYKGWSEAQLRDWDTNDFSAIIGVYTAPPGVGLFFPTISSGVRRACLAGLLIGP